jgi:hypothetical protein
LVTGDKDLLEHSPFKTAQIPTPAEFEKQLEKISPNRQHWLKASGGKVLNRSIGIPLGKVIT